MPGVQPTPAEKEVLDKYVRMIGHSITNQPENAARPKQIKPKLFFFFQTLINARLERTSWEIRGDLLEQDPLWHEKAGLRDFARPFFPEESEQDVRKTLAAALSTGFLAEPAKDHRSITLKALNSLVGIARSYYEYLAGRTAPGHWTVHTKDWQPFNERTFEFMLNETGKPWRALRSEINKAIRVHKKGEKSTYQTDYIGRYPKYFAVINIILARGRLTKGQCYSESEIVGFTPLANDKAIGEGLTDLLEWSILEAQGEMVKLSSFFAEPAEAFVSAICEHYPRLQQDARKWLTSEQRPAEPSAS